MPRPRRRSRHAEDDVKGEKRSNKTHASTIDPEARLYKKAPGTSAVLCFMGHGWMQNRHGLIFQVDLTQADGPAEREAAPDMLHRHFPGSICKLPLGADKAYDAAGFVADLRRACVTPHVAQTARRSAIDGRTTRHKATRCRSRCGSRSRCPSARPRPSSARPRLIGSGQGDHPGADITCHECTFRQFSPHSRYNQ